MEDIEKLKELIIEIRNLTKPYIVWYDNQTKCYNLKGCSKQEVYESFAKIRELVKGNYIFLKDENIIDKILEDDDNG